MKRGQIQLSFGMIFSIIIIIATLAIAGYVLISFLNTGKSVSCKIVYSNLQKEVDSAWRQDIVQDIFEAKLPESVEKICFGFSNQTYSKQDEKAIESIEFYGNEESNILFYPKNGCKDVDFVYKLNHIRTDSFFCVNVVDGKFKIKLNKGRTDKLVKLS
jgi:hypothetical protein